MSHASSPYTTVAALKAADTILGPERVWNAVSDAQGTWLERYRRLAAEAAGVTEIATNATWTAENHVSFLAKHGWKAQLTKCGPDEFLLAAVLDILGNWYLPGDPTRIRGSFAAAKVDRARVFKRRGTNERCVSIQTQAGDAAWLEMMPGAPTGAKLSEEAAARFTDGLEPDDEFDGVIYPCIDFEQKVDNAWLKDIWTMTERSTRAKLLEAKAAFELKLNAFGFRARSSDEMHGEEEGCMAGTPLPPYVIDKPFMLSVVRPKLSLPLFTAHLTEDAWKDPGEL